VLIFGKVKTRDKRLFRKPSSPKIFHGAALDERQRHFNIIEKKENRKKV